MANPDLLKEVVIEGSYTSTYERKDVLDSRDPESRVIITDVKGPKASDITTPVIDRRNVPGSGEKMYQPVFFYHPKA